MNNNNSFLGNIPLITRNLLIINVILFLATILLKKIDLMDMLGMYSWNMSEFKPYQVLTHMFMHNVYTQKGAIDFTHIFFNMFALFMFGSILERFWGAKKFLIYYLFTGIGAAFLQQLVWQLTGTYLAFAIGASGAIFGLLLAYGWMFPNEKLIFIFLPIPIKAKYFVIIYGVVELFLGVARFSGDSVGHFAHLGGMLFGLILLLYWRKKGLMYNERIR